MPRKELGRPRIEIDFETLEKLCKLHCTRDEICNYFGIQDDTLNARIKEQGYKHFSAYYKKHLEAGKISLRRLQWKAAKNGSVPMLIWLGKQMLGQSDKLDQNIKDVTPVLPQFIFEVNENPKDKNK